MNPAKIDNDLLMVDELLWRMYPHTFAEHVGLASAGGPFRSTGLASYLGALISDAVAEGNARIIVNVAPRQGKSELCSYAAPIWFLDNFPERRVIIASHTAELATEFGRRCRNAFSENPNLRASLAEDSKAAGRWNTPEHGGLKAVGVGGGITGFGANLIICDDPHKGWAEAQSPAMRRRVTEWFDGTLMSRLEPNGSIIVVMQRWHRNDLTGHLVGKSDSDWKVCRLPAIARDNDPMGRKAGEAVCPERYDVAALERKKGELPGLVYAANYDQDPQSLGDDRAYSQFVLSDHVSAAKTALRDDLPLQLSWDFNLNPGVHCEIGQYDAKADLFTTRHEVFGERYNTPRMLALLKDVMKRNGFFNPGFRFRKTQVFGDRSGRSERTGANGSASSEVDYELIMRELREWGCNPSLLVPNANPSIRDRLLSVNDALCDNHGNRHWLIHPECVRLIRDLEDVHTDEDGLPDKEDDSDLTHPSDAEGYRIFWLRPIRTMKLAPAWGGSIAKTQ